MVLVPYIHVLSAAFLMGLAAAAPMGPVNMLAIRRGVIGGWRHTLACGIGSITGDLSSSLWSSSGVTTSFRTCPTRCSGLSWRPRAHRPVSAGDLFPVPRRQGASAGLCQRRERWDEGTVRGHLIAEVADAAAMTVFNPLTIAYWVGVTANWLPFAHSILGYSAPGFGILMATAGLITWFTALTVIVRFMPHRSARTSSASSTPSSA